MFRRLLQHLTYANVVATLAFFVALSGGAYAAIKIPANSIGARQLRPASVGSSELAAGAVAAKHLRRGSVGAPQLSATMLKQLAKSTVIITEPSAGSVTADHLADNAVGRRVLQDQAVGTDELAPDAVTGSQVKDGSLLLRHFASNQVSPRLFAHGSSSGVLGVNSGNVSLVRESKGVYLFTFPRSLRGCVPVANVGFGHGPGVIGAGGTAQSSLVSNPDNGVRVTVYRKGFTFNDVEDNDVNLIVLC